jgi:hypothetical protein
MASVKVPSVDLSVDLKDAISEAIKTFVFEGHLKLTQELLLVHVFQVSVGAH